ncbi:MAG: hypothetical protein U5N27_21280 [Rhizobium sp.]|nr:hypothetical protein [Rhizobium sp.]
MNQFMQAESSLILTPRDFHIIDLAMRAADHPEVKYRDDGHREAVGKAVIRLYTSGMTDPNRLAEAASTMSATRLFDAAGGVRTLQENAAGRAFPGIHRSAREI